MTSARSHRLAAGLAAALALGLSSTASAEALKDRFSAGGYFRIMTRPDFQGGDGKLGYWNLYGRLLNEGPWGALELRLDLLQNAPGRADPWAAVVAKIEGGSFRNSDAGRGNLGEYANTQLYVKAGNILLDGVTWQVGTLYSYPGDLGLYDLRPAGLFWETVGLSATWDSKYVSLLLGVGDSGFGIRGLDYSTIPTAGAWLKFHVDHLEIGLGGEYRFEPEVKGNKNAPYATPGVSYEDYVRGEVVQRWLELNPGQELLFPKPESRSSTSFKGVAYLGFGGFGPLRWNNLYANFEKLHPLNYTKETYGGREYTIYVHDLTDQRYAFIVGNEMQLRLVPDFLDAVWGVVYGGNLNDANKVAAGDDNRTYFSTVLRLQAYLTKTLHLLVESSYAQEKSTLGNQYRQHADSIFRNTGGIPDSRGLEFGDSDTRTTWQGKAGFVINPNGMGVFNRPSLRILYGLQYSSQQAAYGNSFVNTLEQYNDFPTATESHWHSVLAIEAETWF